MRFLLAAGNLHCPVQWPALVMMQMRASIKTMADDRHGSRFGIAASSHRSPRVELVQIDTQPQAVVAVIDENRAAATQGVGLVV